MHKNTLLMSSFGVLSLLIFGLQVSDAQMVPAMYVFGDSLVDVGNNNHLPLSAVKANFPHNGIDFPSRKATGRFCNGKNAADVIGEFHWRNYSYSISADSMILEFTWGAEKVGLPSSPPYLSLPSKNASSAITGVNFASGGAGIFNGSDQALKQSLPLTQQVGYYEQSVGNVGAQTQLSKSLFVILIGSNDLFGYSGSSNLQKSTTPQQYVDLMAATLKGLVKRIYATGARKFLLAGVAPIGCIPSQRAKNKSEECNEHLNSMTVMYNQASKSMMEELKSELHGLSYSYFDTYTSLLNLIQKPSDYGFNEVKAACCGLGDLKANVPCLPIATYCSNRKDHVFWDPYHPTEIAARILVDTLFDGHPDYAFPINLRQLLAV